jgi:hypothetical protein
LSSHNRNKQRQINIDKQSNHTARSNKRRGRTKFTLFSELGRVVPGEGSDR